MRIWGAANPHVESIVFSDTATFHLSAKVNRYNVRIWGAANLHFIVEHFRFIPLLIILSIGAFLWKLARKFRLVGPGPQWAWSLGIIYIHVYIINNSEYPLLNNISFIVVYFTILFLQSTKIQEGIMTHLYTRNLQERLLLNSCLLSIA